MYVLIELCGNNVVVITHLHTFVEFGGEKQHDVVVLQGFLCVRSVLLPLGCPEPRTKCVYAT